MTCNKSLVKADVLSHTSGLFISILLTCSCATDVGYREMGRGAGRRDSERSKSQGELLYKALKETNTNLALCHSLAVLATDGTLKCRV